MAITQRGSVLTASDAANSDRFGNGVAISANGLVMAVGANLWEGANSNQGGVYIFDWSGSAWVQRGSVLTASDAASSDEFGTAVALSDDGAILAVGAPKWEGGSSNQGGVYIFDWSGSAWSQRGSVIVYSGASTFGDMFGAGVALSADGAILAVGAPSLLTNSGRVIIYDWSGSAWSQRGSALAASDVTNFFMFGTDVALSDDGAILAVGSTGWGGLTNQGSVYVYDWSGSAWVERSPILQASDKTSNDFYGSGVALSADGAVLAVGAYQAGATVATGQVYLYDWVGGAWVERAILVPADGGSADNFGNKVALSDDASVLVVGAPAWDNSGTDEGGVYVYDVAPDNFATAPTELTMTLSSGQPIAPTELTVISKAYAPTELTVSNPSGAASAQTELTMTATGQPSAATMLAVIDADENTVWTIACEIDGVDVSSRLSTEPVTVLAEEGAARVARVTLVPSSGVIDPLDYVGKPITIDFVHVIAGTPVPRRLFTGKVDTPAYDPASTLLTLSCVDDLQNRVAALDRSTIDTLIGSRYSAAVQGELDDNWDYAQALLSTAAGSLDTSPGGALRYTEWELATTWVTLGDGDLLYRRSRLALPQRSTMVNTVNIEYDYRYARLRERYTTVGWSGTLVDMAPTGYQYPTQQDILGAAGGSGWDVQTAIFYPAPTAIVHSSGGFIYPDADAVSMAILHMRQRHSQTVTERYAITVSAPESIDQNGTLPHALRGALASTFDGTSWESAFDVTPLLAGGGEQDYAPDADRTASDHAIATLLDQARVKILGSHRSARVGNAILCNPDMDLDKRVAISATGMTASGKVVRVEHMLDLAAGSAVTEFDIAVFGAGGAGIITPDTLAPPTPPAAAAATQDWEADVPPLSVNTYGITPYSDDLMGLIINPAPTVYVQDIPPDSSSASYANPSYTAGTYPVQGFRVRMPGVADADRNPIEKPVTSTYSIIIPDDGLSFTVP